MEGLHFVAVQKSRLQERLLLPQVPPADQLVLVELLVPQRRAKYIQLANLQV